MPMRPLSHEHRQRLALAGAPIGQRLQAVARLARSIRDGPDPRSTQRWRRLRLMVLSASPLCADIYGLHGARPVLATQVDHIIGVWDNPELLFDEANLQALCTACHGIKSGGERRRKAIV